MFSFLLIVALLIISVKLIRSKLPRKPKAIAIAVIGALVVIYLLVVFGAISFAKNEPIAGKYVSEYNGCEEEGQIKSPQLELFENGTFKSNLFVRMWGDSALLDTGTFIYNPSKRGEEVALESSGKSYSLSKKRGVFRYSLQMYCGDPDGSKHIDLIGSSP